LAILVGILPKVRLKCDLQARDGVEKYAGVPYSAFTLDIEIFLHILLDIETIVVTWVTVRLWY
jgi:hypothetical protein